MSAKGSAGGGAISKAQIHDSMHFDGLIKEHPACKDCFRVGMVLATTEHALCEKDDIPEAKLRKGIVGLVQLELHFRQFLRRPCHELQEQLVYELMLHQMNIDSKSLLTNYKAVQCMLDCLQGRRKQYVGAHNADSSTIGGIRDPVINATLTKCLDAILSVTHPLSKMKSYHQCDTFFSVLDDGWRLQLANRLLEANRLFCNKTGLLRDIIRKQDTEVANGWVETYFAVANSKNFSSQVRKIPENVVRLCGLAEKKTDTTIRAINRDIRGETDLISSQRSKRNAEDGRLSWLDEREDSSPTKRRRPDSMSNAPKQPEKSREIARVQPQKRVLPKAATHEAVVTSTADKGTPKRASNAGVRPSAKTISKVPSRAPNITNRDSRLVDEGAVSSRTRMSGLDKAEQQERTRAPPGTKKDHSRLRNGVSGKAPSSRLSTFNSDKTRQEKPTTMPRPVGSDDGHSRLGEKVPVAASTSRTRNPFLDENGKKYTMTRDGSGRSRRSARSRLAASPSRASTAGPKKTGQKTTKSASRHSKNGDRLFTSREIAPWESEYVSLGSDAPADVHDSSDAEPEQEPDLTEPRDKGKGKYEEPDPKSNRTGQPRRKLTETMTVRHEESTVAEATGNLPEDYDSDSSELFVRDPESDPSWWTQY